MALDTFKLDNGFYPSTEQGLDALIKKPTKGRIPDKYPEEGYLRKDTIPKDPYGNNFNYTYPGQINIDYFDLWSNGVDQEEGTSDDIANFRMK